MKKLFTAFTLTSTLMVSNLSAVTSQYLESEKNIVSNIENKSKIIENKDNLEEIINLLENSSLEFEIKVIGYLFKNYQEFIKDNQTELLGKNLALVASHIDNKNKVYNESLKLFRKDKEFQIYKAKIEKLIQANSELKNKIQHLIDLTFMEIEAKNSFKALQLLATREDENFKLDSYWYSIDENRENKALFISSKYLEDKEIEEVYKIEDEFSKLLSQNSQIKSSLPKNIFKNVDEYSFNSFNKSFFKRVSFI